MRITAPARLLLGLTGVLLCSIQAHADAPSPRADTLLAHAGFQPGEAFTYTFSVGIIEAGRARMSVGLPEDKPGGKLVAVLGDAQSSSWLAVIAKLDDSYKVVMDASVLEPRHVVSVESGVRDRRIESRVDGKHVAIEFKAIDREEHQVRDLPGPPRDPVSALFALRSARLANGDRFQMLALDGVALYLADVTVIGRESIEVAGGKLVATVRLAITATRIDDAGHRTNVPQRHFRMWLTDDERRIPQRVSGDTDLGEARLELTSYLPGATDAALATVDATVAGPSLDGRPAAKAPPAAALPPRASHRPRSPRVHVAHPSTPPTAQ